MNLIADFLEKVFQFNVLQIACETFLTETVFSFSYSFDTDG